MKLLLTISLILLLAGCSSSNPPIKEGIATPWVRISEEVYKFHDDEDNATCWVYAGRGISCIPDQFLK